MLVRSQHVVLLDPAGRSSVRLVSHFRFASRHARQQSKFSASATIEAGSAVKQACSAPEAPFPAASSDSGSTKWLWLLAPSVLCSFPASAESISYAPGEGADVVKNVAGLAYAALLAFWLFKVIGRRVKRSTSEARQGSTSPQVCLL